MITKELCFLNGDTANSLVLLKNDIEEYLRDIEPHNFDANTHEYAFNAFETVKYTGHLLTLERVIEALNKNKPDIISIGKWLDVQKMCLDCADGWPDYIDDLNYVKEVFLMCNQVADLIEKKNLDIDGTDLSNPCAIADAIETVADCLKDAIYLSENGEDCEWEEALADIETYRIILKFLMALA